MDSITSLVLQGLELRGCLFYVVLFGTCIISHDVSHVLLKYTQTHTRTFLLHFYFILKAQLNTIHDSVTMSFT